MGRFVVRRLVSAIFVMWVIMTLSFFLMRAAPGGPFDADRRLHPTVEANLWATYGMATMVRASHGGRVAQVLVKKGDVVAEHQPILRLEEGETISAHQSGECLSVLVSEQDHVLPEQNIAALKTPIAVQYLTAMRSYLTLDFGVTYSSEGQRTVFETIAQTAPVSMELGVYAMLIALILGIPTGLVAGLRPNTWVDYTAMSMAMTGVSLSEIVLGPMLVLLFAVHLGWFELSGWATPSAKILPAFTLGLIYAAYFARLTRGGMLEVIRQDYIRTARAKGLDERTIVLRHALRGAILPSVTFLGPALAGTLTGSVVVERIYNIPGVSEFFVSGALNRDYPLVMGVVVLYSGLLVLLNLLVDIAYVFLDPRVNYD